jgi:16S rRNA (guanine(966)-N(2))-methyltransferase RsmD
MRETVFNLLGNTVKGSAAIDVFAGVGTLGIEALSRGARTAHFIEKGQKALRYLRRNLDNIGAGDEAVVLAGDVFRVLKRLQARGMKFDLVFCDPPYGEGLLDRVLSIENESPFVEPGGVLAIQYHAKDQVSWSLSRYVLEKQRTLGDTTLSILAVK